MNRKKLLLWIILIYIIPGIPLFFIYFVWPESPLLRLLIALSALFTGQIVLYVFYPWAIGCTLYFIIAYTLLYRKYKREKLQEVNEKR